MVDLTIKYIYLLIRKLSTGLTSVKLFKKEVKQHVMVLVPGWLSVHIGLIPSLPP